MRITIDLAANEAIALRRFANSLGEEPADAAHVALRERLIGGGYLDMLLELDEDTETEGNA